jgi:hypothetical protein
MNTDHDATEFRNKRCEDSDKAGSREEVVPYDTVAAEECKDAH